TRAFTRSRLSQPELNLERMASGSGKPLNAIEQRRAQLMQHGERQLHLRLHPQRTHDAHVRGRPDRIVQQRRLPTPRLTPYDEHTAATGPCPVTQLVEDRALVSP